MSNRADEIPDWSKPTPALLAALALVDKRRPNVCRPRRGTGYDDEPTMPLPTTHVAEMLLMIGTSLGGICIRDWSEKAPDCYELTGPDDETTAKIHEAFRAGAEIMHRIIQSGYNATTGKFWDVLSIWPDRAESERNLVTLARFGWLIRQVKYPTSAMDLIQNRSPLMIPASVEMILEVVLGHDYLDRFQRAIDGKPQKGQRRSRKAAS